MGVSKMSPLELARYALETSPRRGGHLLDRMALEAVLEELSQTVVPSCRLGDDRHQVALWRLDGVVQYLDDVRLWDALPVLPAESVVRACDLLRLSMRDGQRSRRSCLSGQLVLRESWR